MAKTIHCPYCDEQISANAKKCRHCGEWLSGPDPTRKIKYTDSFSMVKNQLADRYEILEEIGRGGMAMVYKAKHKKLNRIVALKVLHTNLVHDHKFVDRFHREAQLSSLLNHPNIVSLFEIDQISDTHILAMEYLEGKDLHSLIRDRGTLNPAETVRIIKSMADALDHAHSKGIIHRDIKSSNIIISSQGKPVLTDFGIAHAVSSTKLTQTGSIIGTPEYMSPEQAQGHEVDGRSDFYSLGIVMYECLTGRVPFKADNPLTVIHKIVNADPVSPRHYNPQIPESLEQVINGLLKKDPQERISNGRQLERIFRQMNFSSQVPVSPKKKIGKPGTPGKRKKKPAKADTSEKQNVKKTSWKAFDMLVLIVTGALMYILGELTELKGSPPEISTILAASACLLIAAISYPVPLYGFIFGAYLGMVYYGPALINHRPDQNEFTLMLLVLSLISLCGLVLFSVAWLIARIKSLRGKFIASLSIMLLIIISSILYTLFFGVETVRVRSVPDGASVCLNDIYQGKTPCLLRVKPKAKRYILSLDMEGYFPVDTPVNLKNSRSSYKFYLQEKRLSISIQSTPSGAGVYQDGVNVGITPCSLALDADHPEHQISLKKDYFADLHINLSTESVQNGQDNYTLRLLPETSGSFPDQRDHEIYRWVRIGSQVWMAENLNYNISGSACYDNHRELCDSFGRLYNWESASGACPEGWHLPSDDEWKELELFLGMSRTDADKSNERGSSQGKMLKSRSGWSHNGSGSNESGFNAFPAGAFFNNISMSMGSFTAFWTSSPSGYSNAWLRALSGTNEISRVNYPKENRFSVRCLKNDPIMGKDEENLLNSEEFSGRSTSSQQLRNELIQLITSYYNALRNEEFDKLRSFYNDPMEQWYNSMNHPVDKILTGYRKYIDRWRYRRTEIRWATFKANPLPDGAVQVNYYMDYYIRSKQEDPYQYYYLYITVIIDENYKFRKMYEESIIEPSADN
ncbi:MAG: protein kinase [Bacteroidales bacterium]|nr:protein kinase [Bacteroidales bacterium]